ncbi:cobalamin biosynthesis protein [Rheinheimera sp. MMS21-TC3]|uniref:cobalamin biosynthesis protein n=1 Tax=Rheinheimera sp. MMS21-TC3 TaxID=3072790 RepID=UPI0028C4A7E9|nr:cobalamin biosynthesis protein [Rheinheimera sp. MMS21-TC3]WNO62046.1 cobalamin biosynthesis protein [Rheinheimera sp. MMS21-TC3]
MSWLTTVPTYPLILIAVMIVSRLIPLPDAYHPLTFFRFFAQQLAKKVNPDLQRSKQQQLLSGSLAIAVALLPCIILFYALYQFSELPLILDALLLYCSLDWHAQSKVAVDTSLLLQKKQLSLARQQAAKILLRDTDKVNVMGLSKAIIESVLLQSSKLFIATLGYFLLGGGLAALSYRLLQELQRQWNPKLKQFHFFGRPASLLANLLAFPALLLSSIIIAIQYGIVSCFKSCQQKPVFFNKGSFYLLSCSSIALKRDLGGPAFYSQKKILRQRFNTKDAPSAADIIIALRMVNFLHLYLLLLVIAANLLIYLR